MSNYLFDKFRQEKCKICLRAGKCPRMEHDIILCSSSSFYKGPEDVRFLSEEEKREFGIEPEETK